MWYYKIMNEATGSSVINSAKKIAATAAVKKDEAENIFLPQEKKETRKEIQVSPTPQPTFPPPEPIQYNFFNVRVIGVLIGIIFLWIYIKGLHKK